MNITPSNLPRLAELLTQERKRQKLSRSEAAAVCNVSPSFIRDAETQPERCSLGKLTLLVNGLGLTMVVTDRKDDAGLGIIAQAIADGRTVQFTDDGSPSSKAAARGIINQAIAEGRKRRP